MTTKPLLILADDLTGAADTAARCRHAGLPAIIYLQPPLPPLPEGVTAFTSDSRHLSPAAAAQRVEEVVAPLRSYDARWYKKIDSTLRGNLGSELDTLLDQVGATTALVCPAFPAQGRGLLDGYLVAPSLPPIHLPSLLRKQSHRQVESIALADVRTETLAERLYVARMQSVPLLVIDAMTEGDLDQILAAVEAAMPDALLCGSAGLVGALTARETGHMISETGSSPAMSRNATGNGQQSLRTLFIVGSGSDTAHRQIDTLARQRVDVISLGVEHSPGSLAERCDPAGPVWLLHLPRPAPDTPLDGPQARQWSEHLGNAALVLIEHLQPTLLILSGGDTALNVLMRLGIDHLTVQVELLAGMPLCSAVSRRGQPINVIMKPGSFGDEHTFATLLEKAATFLTFPPG